MTVFNGDTGRFSMGVLKSGTITAAAARETLLGSALTLPTSEPSPQITYTVQAGDLPTFGGTQPRSVVYLPLMYAAGKIGAAVTNLNYRILLNGVSQIASSNNSIAATQYWTYNFCRYIPVVVGDVITISLWSSQPDTTMDYYALQIQPSRMQFAPQDTILRDFFYGAGSFVGALTKGTPVAFNSGNFAILPTDSNSVSISVSSTALTFRTIIQDPLYQTGRCWQCDANNTTSVNTHATSRPYYNRNFIPQTWSFREVLR